MEEVEAGARMGLRLLRRSRSSTPPSRVEQIEKFSRSGISFVRTARGAAYPPQSRRRASEKRSYQSCEGVSRTEGTVCVIASRSGSCANWVCRFSFSETIFVSTNFSLPVPIRNVLPPLRSHFGIARVPYPALTSDLRQQIILHASARCCPTRQELLRRRWLCVSVLF